MPPIKQDPTIRRIVNRFEKAVRSYDNMGAQHPFDHPTISLEYSKAKEELIGYMNSLHVEKVLAARKGFSRGQRDAESRARNRPGDGDMGG